MNRKVKLSIGLLAFVLCVCCLPKASSAAGENWKLGMQAYSFKEFTFFEAVDKNKALGMRYIECYPGQRLSKEKPDVKTDHNMSSADRKLMLQKLREASVRLMNYGVVGLPNDKAECRKVFDFAKEMGIETIVSEPPEDAFDLIEDLCEEFKTIKVAIHNHPKPSHYWDPDTVLRVCKGRSKSIGACADTGHWTRSGVDPLEAIKKLGSAGRIISLHFKDLDKFGSGAKDVPWGTGVSKARKILAELARQNFKGVFSVEWEHNWLNSMPDIAKCATFFERTAAELDQTDWQWIFNGKDLSGWDGDSRLWSVKDGVIHGQTTPEKPARGNTFLIWRDGKLKDFELRLRFRLENGNSGVQYRSKEVSKWVVSGYQAEVENNPGKVGFLYHERGRGWLTNVGDFMVIDDKGKKEVVSNVSDVDELVKTGYYEEKGWNEYRIIAQGNHIVHYLNGYQTIELIDNDRVTNPDDPKDTKGAAREGILALQIHQGPPMVVQFKDIRIKNLESKYGDAVLLFDGKNLDDWEVKDSNKSKWVVGKAKMSQENPKMLVNRGDAGEMINLASKHGDSIDIFSKKKFGDCRIELQLMVPKGSNSGIYVMGEYEIQVLDSWERGTKMSGGDMGAVYAASPPSINASRRPGQWQRYVIDFRAPRFDSADKKIPGRRGKARLLRVELNDQLLHENLMMDKETPGGVIGEEAATGPLMFQGNHGPVAYRNIIVKRLKK